MGLRVMKASASAEYAHESLIVTTLEPRQAQIKSQQEEPLHHKRLAPASLSSISESLALIPKPGSCHDIRHVEACVKTENPSEMTALV